MDHRGELVEKIVRKSGYSLSKLAKKLNISRNTLYNRFHDPNLGYRFIMEVGNVIYYDFTFDFPEIKQEPSLGGEDPISVPLQEDGSAALWRIETKYAQLVGKYRRLINTMVKIAQQNEQPALEREFRALKEELIAETKSIS